MSEYDDDKKPRRKRRTREHVLEDLSENHLEHKVLLKGHSLRRVGRDYGVDVIMFHFARDGSVENGEVRFQLKATDRLGVVNAGTEVSFPIKTGDLDCWSKESYPFILVVFDAGKEVAYWLHIQEYVRLHPDCLSSGKKSVNVRMPITNTLTAKSIEAFREMSLQMVRKMSQLIESLGNHGRDRDAKRKPK